jgi:hypothetical protein
MKIIFGLRIGRSGGVLWRGAELVFKVQIRGLKNNKRDGIFCYREEYQGQTNGFVGFRWSLTIRWQIEASADGE